MVGKRVQLLEQRLGVSQIGGVETFGEPVVDFREHAAPITSMLPPFPSIYVGAKAAMEACSSVLAGELVSRGITVNVISPGAVETKMLRGLPKEFQEGLAQHTPLGIGQPSDIAGIVCYLASDEGRWITNEKIRCDGGIR